MKTRARLSPNRRPKISGKTKIRVKIDTNDPDYITATAIAVFPKSKKNIGYISAYRNSRSQYLTVNRAFLNKGWTGRGYGHILYWALAKEAKKIGLKGLRSFTYSRNHFSNGAWIKIQNYSRGDFSYLKLD